MLRSIAINPGKARQTGHTNNFVFVFSSLLLLERQSEHMWKWIHRLFSYISLNGEYQWNKAVIFVHCKLFLSFLLLVTKRFSAADLLYRGYLLLNLQAGLAKPFSHPCNGKNTTLSGESALVMGEHTVPCSWGASCGTFAADGLQRLPKWNIYFVLGSSVLYRAKVTT